MKLVIFLFVYIIEALDFQQTLHTINMPLVGGPRWLRLHQAVVFEDKSEGRLRLLDFMPREPQSLETAAKLLSFNSVEGIVRAKEISAMPRFGSITKSIEMNYCDLEALASKLFESYDRQLSLRSNNCRTFVGVVIEEAYLQQQRRDGLD